MPEFSHVGMDMPSGPHIVRAGEGGATGESGFFDRYLFESPASSGRVALLEHVLGPKILAAPCTATAAKTNARSYRPARWVIEEGIEVTAGPADLLRRLAEPGGEYSKVTLAALAAEYGAEVDFDATMPLVERHGLTF